MMAHNVCWNDRWYPCYVIRNMDTEMNRKDTKDGSENEKMEHEIN